VAKWVLAVVSASRNHCLPKLSRRLDSFGYPDKNFINTALKKVGVRKEVRKKVLDKKAADRVMVGG
jgi:hypothetical protein